MAPPAARPEVIDAFRKQAQWCTDLGSPFTAALLKSALCDLETGGPLAQLVGQWPGEPTVDALALRFAGALHALALSGADAELKRLYPPNGPGTLDPHALWQAATQAIAAHREHMARYLASPPQTNEIGRSVALLGGFLTIAQATQVPLRLFEIGASAGLNLVFDRFRYRLGTRHWGDPTSPVLLAPEWQGGLPPLAASIAVQSRQGCDLRPIDLEDAGARLRLKSYVWPDQTQRHARLDGAIALARAERVRVVAHDAGAWVEAMLAMAAPDATRVVYHSIVWQYLPPAVRQRIESSLHSAGGDATAEAPLAWLRLEPDGPGYPWLKLTLWPGGGTRTLARAHFHGASVTWQG